MTVGGATGVIEGCGLEISGNGATTNDGGRNSSSSGTSGDTVDPPDTSPDGPLPISDGGDGGEKCPEPCTRCNANGVCEIDCGGSTTPCKTAIVTCAPARQCLVRCQGESSCQGAVIYGPPADLIVVECGGKDSCKGTVVNAGLVGQSCVRCQDNTGGAVSCHDTACGVSTTSTCELRCEDGGCGNISRCEACKAATCP